MVGAGGNTRLKHLPGFKAIPGVELVAVCNRTRASGEKVAVLGGFLANGKGMPFDGLPRFEAGRKLMVFHWRLRRLAVDKLKVDQSFVRDLTEDPEDAAIVRAIIQLGRSLRLITLAEGVDEAVQARLGELHGGGGDEQGSACQIAVDLHETAPKD